MSLIVNYLFKLFLVPQVEGDVEEWQERVDELEKRHFSNQVIIVLWLFAIVLYKLLSIILETLEATTMTEKLCSRQFRDQPWSLSHTASL